MPINKGFGGSTDDGVILLKAIKTEDTQNVSSIKSSNNNDTGRREKVKKKTYK
jgi:hypothetical protein